MEPTNPHPAGPVPEVQKHNLADTAQAPEAGSYAERRRLARGPTPRHLGPLRRGVAMAIVKGDRIAESSKLNDRAKVSKGAFWAYAYFVSALRDDFGRFRFSARSAVAKLTPRRPDVTEAEVKKFLREYKAADLIVTWEVDGATFGKWTGAVCTGNRFHSTPEPPGSKHEHNGYCLSTAIRQAKLWSQPDVEALSIQLKHLRDLRSDQRSDLGSDQRSDLKGDQRRDPPSATSSPSSPSSPSATSATSASTDDGLQNDLVEQKLDAIALSAVRDVWAYFTARCQHPRAQLTNERTKILRARLREEPGTTVERIAGMKAAVDGAVGDPFFNGSETGKQLLDFNNVFKHQGRDRIEKLQRLAQEQASGAKQGPKSKADQRADAARAMVAGGLREE